MNTTELQAALRNHLRHRNDHTPFRYAIRALCRRLTAKLHAAH